MGLALDPKSVAKQSWLPSDRQRTRRDPIDRSIEEAVRSDLDGSVVLVFCAPLVFVYATWFVVACRCQDCGLRRTSATRCSCGRDHLTLPKLWTRQPFEVQLSGPN